MRDKEDVFGPVCICLYLYLPFICFAFACICFCLICMPASVSGFRTCVWGSLRLYLGLWERPLASTGRAALHGTHSLPHPSLNHTLPHRPPLPRPPPPLLLLLLCMLMGSLTPCEPLPPLEAAGLFCIWGSFCSPAPSLPGWGLPFVQRPVFSHPIFPRDLFFIQSLR